MSSALDQLAELIRQKEATTRAKKIRVELEQASTRLRAAEQHARQAEQAIREGRTARQRELEAIDGKEVLLKELIRKCAMYRQGHEPFDASAEKLIADSRIEIDTERRTARAELDRITKASEEANRELLAAIEVYRTLRREIERNFSSYLEECESTDRVLRNAETLLPGGRLHALAREVEDGQQHFGMITRKEQYAQLKIWIGRYRLLQTEGCEAPDDPGLTQRIFHLLKALSKQYEPGYIDAFRLEFQADWTRYVSEAEAQLQSASEDARRNRESEHARDEQHARELERQRLSRVNGRITLDALREQIARDDFPDEGFDDFLEQLKQVVNCLGASDPELLSLAMPYREQIDGDGALRALRLSLDRKHQEETREDDTLPEGSEEVVDFTHDRRGLMIGGSVREDVRRNLERLFGFGKLDWEPYEDSKPALLESLEQRVRHGGVDVVILLKSFIGHHVTEKMRPLCQQHEILCVMVERGYGASQIAEALRRGLQKSA